MVLIESPALLKTTIIMCSAGFAAYTRNATKNKKKRLKPWSAKFSAINPGLNDDMSLTLDNDVNDNNNNNADYVYTFFVFFCFFESMLPTWSVEVRVI